MSDVTWLSTLEALEGDLDGLQADIASGTTGEQRPPVELRTDLGPLPEELRERATALHARMREAEHALAAVVDRSRRGVAFSDRMAPDAPRFLDARW